MRAKKILMPLSILIAIIIFVFPGPVGWYILLDSTGVIDDIVYGSHIPSKEESFQMVYENQEEFEVLVDNMEQLLKERGEDVLILRGKFEYYRNNVKNPIIKKYPIKRISVDNLEQKLEVTFDYEFESNNIQGVYYVSNDMPTFWGEYEDKDIEEKNGVYTTRGSYYIYETEKITEHWYYYHVKMW